MRKLLLTLALTIPTIAQPPSRPRITGISHVAYYVSDMPRALTFWHDLLGFDLSYNRLAPNANDTTVAFLKVNDHQYVELLANPPTGSKNFMSHLCFLTDDVEKMRLYLAALGVSVPAHTSRTRTGDLVFQVSDPDGTQIEFSQPQPGSVEAQGRGKFVPTTRISQRIYHVGFLVGDTARAMDFYTRILGFHETWRGASSPTQLSWINMQVPDPDPDPEAPPGNGDYVEFMLYSTLPTTFGNSNHVALEVPSIAAAVAALQSSPAFAAYGKSLTPHTGVNGKRQLNLYDPDGTRVELMEPSTADGRPVPSSTAPPPSRTTASSQPLESQPPSQPVRPLEKIGGNVSAPILTHSVEPAVPKGLRHSPAILVNLIVEANGEPSHVHLRENSEPQADVAITDEDGRLWRQYQQAVLDAVTQYRFKPAMKNGQPVAVEMNVEVNVSLF